MRMGARQLLREFQVVRDQRRGINRIVMGQCREQHLRGLVVFLAALLVQIYLNPLLHLGLKDQDILNRRRLLTFPITRAGNKHLLRMDRMFLDYPQRTEHLVC
jgi:hypothetical protein